METNEICTETVSSMITDSTTMIVTECPRLPQGVGHTCLGNTMTDALTSGGRRIPVDPRETGFDARSILMQGLVDRNRAH